MTSPLYRPPLTVQPISAPRRRGRWYHRKARYTVRCERPAAGGVEWVVSERRGRRRDVIRLDSLLQCEMWITRWAS